MFPSSGILQQRQHRQHGTVPEQPRLEDRCGGRCFLLRCGVKMQEQSNGYTAALEHKKVQQRSAEREGQQASQPASIPQLTLPWLCSSAHTSTRPLSHFLSHTQARRIAEAVQRSAAAPSSAPPSGCLPSVPLESQSVVALRRILSSHRQSCQ